MLNKVVARYTTGTLVKGTALNVDHAKSACHVRTIDGRMVEVRFDELKALFFVKSLDGDPSHQEGMDISQSDPRVRGSFVVELRFRDGERLVGLANRYPPLGTFFFVVPVDTGSNNVRILVNRQHVISMECVGRAA